MGREQEKPPQETPAENPIEKAGSYEELIVCWERIINSLDPEQVKKWGTIDSCLKIMYDCFCKPGYGCDSAAKQIFDQEGYSERLEQLGIPEEFLLHTVRVGALKGMLYRVEKSPKNPVDLPYDGTSSRLARQRLNEGVLEDPEAEIKRLIGMFGQSLAVPNLDGYSWANGRLEELDKQRRERDAEKGKREEQEKEQAKKAAIERIKLSMHEKNFRVDSADAELLKEDFKGKLRLWKSFLESHEGRELDEFIKEHGEEKITQELFTELREVCENNTKIKDEWFLGRKDSPVLPLEIIDPSSGWFGVLIINKQTRLKDFISSAYSNMDAWFVL
ncbi:MAG TPA: hypothetical protein VJB41_03620 [Patescibacteria group bacterium]|nr:hypothetical protein [Patescibacteria group bacterium]